MDKNLNTIKEIVKKHPIVFFDGICNLCNTSIQLIIKNDRKNKFLFAQLQSDKVKEFLRQQEEDFSNTDSILLVTPKKIYTKSSAALKIAKDLKGFYPLLYIFYIIPKPIRDVVYDLIAKNRYKWFGKEESCMIPTAALKNKFL